MRSPFCYPIAAYTLAAFSVSVCQQPLSSAADLPPINKRQGVKPRNVVFILADDLAETIISVAGNNNARRRIFNTAGPDVIESWQYYQIVADVLGVELILEEVPVKSYLAEHPEKAPFICHRIYDLRRIEASGLSVPSTPIAEGLRLHMEGLLARKDQA